MPNVGYATLSIIPSARGFQKALAGQTSGPVDATGKSSGARFGKAFTAAAAVGIAGGAAVIAGGVASVFKAGEFDAQMREVFTLLPDISGEAMSEMSDQVLDFSSEFGVLPDKTIPALYQALSAGVPKDNVFDFLETAQRAAKGGVTDLETAVDGISSVVNAYGDDVISASEASDLMFTAVRLGKTDFEQLSGSLFNVIPTASALGVEFGDVTAGLAALTAQGVPTNVATTQMRQLFVELSKAGGDAAKTFEDAAGQSFQDFIAAGGDTAGALSVMLAAAEDTGVGIQDLFGSVEAGQAALALAGSETFTENLEEMGGAAGATDAAFETMNQGLSATLDRLRAKFQVFMIQLGSRLLPIVETVVDWFETRAVPALQDFAGEMRDRLIPVVQAAGRFIVGTLWPALQDLGVVMRDRVVPAAQALIRGVTEVFNFLRDNQPVLAGVAAVIGVVLVNAIIGWTVATWAAVAPHIALAAAMVVAYAPVVAIALAIGALVAAVVYAYQEWDVFRGVVDAVGRFLRDKLWPALQAIWKVISERVIPIIVEVITFWVKLHVEIARRLIPIIQRAIEIFGSIVSFITGSVIPTLGRIISKIVEVATAVGNRVSDIVGFITGIPGRIADTVSSLFQGVADRATTVKNWVSDRIDDIVTFFTELPGRIIEGIGDIGSTVWSGIQSGFEFIRDQIGGIADSIVDFFRELPGRILDVLGGIGSTIVNFIEDQIPGGGIVGGAIDFVGGIFAEGGVVPGRPHEAVPIIAHGGEAVFNRHQQANLLDLAEGRSGGSSEPVSPVHIDHAEFSDPVDLDALFRRARFAMVSG